MSLLAETMPDLCGACHGFEDPDFSSAHLGIEAKAMNCTRCHNPHYSTDPKFFQEEIHAPFASGACEECHVVNE